MEPRPPAWDDGAHFMCESIEEWSRRRQPPRCVLSERAWVVVRRWEAGAGEELHNAPVDLIWLVLEGEAEVTIGEEVRPAKPGTLVAVPAGVVRGLQSREALTVIEIGFDEEPKDPEGKVHP